MSSPPSSPSPLCLMMGDAPEFRPAVIGAMEIAYPGADARTVATVEEATQLTAENTLALLALLRPGGAELNSAVNAVDAFGLPRWAVVAFGEVAGSEEVVSVLRADEEPRTIARSLRLAMAMHQLRRDNARYRGDLSAIGTRVAHDLRSPLGGVVTTVEVLKEVLAEENPGRVEMLDPVIESSEGLTKLIRQLSVLAKASGGQSSRERFNMGLAFWSAFQRVEREAASVGASIKHSAAWPDVEGDQGWVEVMWHALLANSLQHAGPQPRIEVGWTRREGENRFWIIDAGEVPVGNRASLFQPFHLFHRPNAPRGFGLAIVQRLAELQGGKSGFEPEPGGGSCFFFTLPMLETGSATAAASPLHGKR
ncbi:MAG: HAMP domain-containing sensor histidine kinase [Opitutaceae bacterium]